MALKFGELGLSFPGNSLESDCHLFLGNLLTQGRKERRDLFIYLGRIEQVLRQKRGLRGKVEVNGKSKIHRKGKWKGSK